MRLSWDPTQEQRLLGRTEESPTAGEPSAIDWTAVLEIEDTGMGISLEVQQMIFEPFFTTKREGTGLGLATVQRIIEQHGGSIQVSSQPGAGTCFRMQLPSVELNR
jgi:signal transduction histidine kinase